MKTYFFTLLASAVLLTSFARADTVYTVTLNTSPLVGSGPFTVDLQFLDGSGTPGDLNNNIVKLQNFAFGTGGSPSGGGTASNGASGSLSLGVTMKDTAFLNEYTENFTPGNLLSFSIDTTNVLDPGGTPDLFVFAILDNMGNDLPTAGPGSEFLDVTLGGGATPVVTPFASVPGSVPFLDAPIVQLQNPGSVPEPSLRWLPLIAALCGWAVRFVRKEKPA